MGGFFNLEVHKIEDLHKIVYAKQKFIHRSINLVNKNQNDNIISKAREIFEDIIQSIDNAQKMRIRHNTDKLFSLSTFAKGKGGKP